MLNKKKCLGFIPLQTSNNTFLYCIRIKTGQTTCLGCIPIKTGLKFYAIIQLLVFLALTIVALVHSMGVYSFLIIFSRVFLIPFLVVDTLRTRSWLFKSFSVDFFTWIYLLEKLY